MGAEDPAATITITILAKGAIHLADALDTMETWLEDDVSLGEDLPHGSHGDLESQLSAVRHTSMHLGKELPKHFPLLSRAERRAYRDEGEE
tara:strand:- start:546 stop:818 length:273 start_codon:yes stop_codon:yes gene_type:complete